MSINAPAEPSCWEEALLRFRSECPKLYKHLEEIRATQPQSSPDSLAEDLLTVIDAKRKTLENHELHLPFNVRNSDVKARIQRALDIIWKAVQVFKTVGDLATNIDPLHAGVAWSGMNIILQMALNGAEQNTAALEGLAQISPLVARYAKIEELYIKHRNDTKLNKAFRACLTDLYVTILRYQVSVAHHCQRNKFVQYARALPKMDDWKALLQEIMSKDADCRKYTEIFDAEDQVLRHGELEILFSQLNTHMDAINRRTHEVLEQNQKLTYLKEQKDILDWISTAVPRQDHRMIMENSKLDRDYAKAGQWLFRHPDFETWSSRQSEDSSTIWLCGPVGTGKSSLVCLVIEHCLREIQSSNTDEVQMAYFYCSRKQGEPAGSDSKTILRSLLRQLVWSADNHSTSSAIRDIYDESRLSHESGESRLSVRACISLLSELMSARQNSTIIIDALDECSDPLELLSNLNEIATSANSNTKFFFSSRMNVDVREELPQCAKVEINSQSNQDIEIYVKTEVKTRKRRLLHGKAPELEDRLIEILTRRAQGMFRWVQLQLEIFFSPKTPLRHSKDVIGKLDRLDEDVRAPQLDTVYDEIYEMNVQQSQDRINASTALKWIMCSLRPLKIAELVEAVSIDMEGNIDTEIDETYVMQICSNLLVTDDAYFVQFAHLSVREYLMSRKAYSDIEAQAQAAKTCLAYVLHTDISQVIDFDEGSGISAYAIKYWPFHCSMTGKLRQQDDSLQKMFNEFMSTSQVHDAFVQWMKLLPSAVVYMWFNERHTAESSICVPPSPWFTACAWGFFEVLQASLHNSKPDLERRNAQGETSLWVASRYGHLDIAKALIENDVDIDSTDQYGYTALHASIIYKKRDITRLLLGNNASCTKRIGDLNGDEHDTLRIDRYDGLDALHLAAYDGSEEIMRLLLEKKVDINARNSTQGETALHIAAGQNHAEQVRLLIEYGACIDLESGQGGTAIGQAAILGHVDIVRILADELHSNEDSKWWVKVARVMRAIKLSDELQVQQLLDDDENDDYSGKQPLLSKWPLVFKALQSAVITGCQKIVTILLSKGADANMPDDYGTTPLHLATHHRKYGVQKLLLDHGVNIEAANCRGWRALHYAAQNENALDMIQSLVEKGANIEAEGEEGRRALHYAARNRRYHETVQLLLKRGADIEAEDDNGWRALHYAARANNLSEVQFLLEKGANVDSEDISGTTALDLAVYRVSVGVTRLLLEKGAIPRRVYVKYSEPKYPRRGVKERWGAIQKMISAWSESDSDYR